MEITNLYILKKDIFEFNFLAFLGLSQCLHYHTREKILYRPSIGNLPETNNKTNL